MSRKLIPGFDYRAGTQFQRTAKAWREELLALIEKGGRRRYEGGETYGHDRKGLIAFEIYGRVDV